MSKQAIYLKDYQVPDFLSEQVSLAFDLSDTVTTVDAVMQLSRNPASAAQDAPLVLNGEAMKLVSLTLDGASLTESDYSVTDDQLTIHSVPNTPFELATRVEIKPQENKSLIGLYTSSNNYCTQCESHGFRRITYFLDRPDVLTRFKTKITANKTQYPHLLSNGNLINQGDNADGRHWAEWEDPSLKPCYLFALVAGDFDLLEDHFTTMSGRTVTLAIYVEKGKGDQADHAMLSLKQSMQWDEETFGREYDLDIYMIVAVSDFNFGAMENKGLNVFNTKYVLAKSDTATDTDYLNIQGVIGHEYFHNWTGNRVTLRNWFQITLKEGLTVFRDESFSADMNSPTVKRIQDVNGVRNVQFAEDAGPMAHPIRPDSYIEMNNFYTATVYRKGAEIIRMMHTFLGKEMFRKAMDLYFERHDGDAVTTEEFVKAMEDASGIDLTQFRLWYSQAGTPTLDVSADYDASKKQYTLKVKQTVPATPGQPNKKPMQMPLTVGLLDEEGNDVPITLQGDHHRLQNGGAVLTLNQSKQQFVFENIPSKPIPSLLRNFSAPVILNYDYSDDALIFLMKHDNDAFNRWEAAQKLSVKIMLGMMNENATQALPPAFIDAFRHMIEEPDIDALYRAELLTLPTERYLHEAKKPVDVDAVHQTREWVREQLSQHLHDHWLKLYLENHRDGAFDISLEAMGRRRIKNLALSYLMKSPNEDVIRLATDQFYAAHNMTDELSALAVLTHCDCDAREKALAFFYNKWKDEALVIDKWFMLQATSMLPGALGEVKKLTEHPAYDPENPNNVNMLVSAFAAGNHAQFHDKSGVGYAFLADHVIHSDVFNPLLASRLITPLTQWEKYDTQRQDLMRAELERIAQHAALSPDLYEVISKSLGQ